MEGGCRLEEQGEVQVRFLNKKPNQNLPYSSNLQPLPILSTLSYVSNLHSISLYLHNSTVYPSLQHSSTCIILCTMVLPITLRVATCQVDSHLQSHARLPYLWLPFLQSHVHPSQLEQHSSRPPLKSLALGTCSKFKFMAQHRLTLTMSLLPLSHNTLQSTGISYLISYIFLNFFG